MHHSRIALIKTTWHDDIVTVFADSCRQALEDAEPSILTDTFTVPGVVETPLFAQQLIATQRYDQLVVIGLIADHGVYRHDFVARSVMDSIMDLQLRTGVPIVYGILTPQDFISEGREKFFQCHFVKKGHEAANACLRNISNARLLQELNSI